MASISGSQGVQGLIEWLKSNDGQLPKLISSYEKDKAYYQSQSRNLWIACVLNNLVAVFTIAGSFIRAYLKGDYRWLLGLGVSGIFLALGERSRSQSNYWNISALGADALLSEASKVNDQSKYEISPTLGLPEHLNTLFYQATNDVQIGDVTGLVIESLALENAKNNTKLTEAIKQACGIKKSVFISSSLSSSASVHVHHQSQNGSLEDDDGEYSQLLGDIVKIKAECIAKRHLKNEVSKEIPGAKNGLEHLSELQILPQNIPARPHKITDEIYAKYVVVKLGLERGRNISGMTESIKRTTLYQSVQQLLTDESSANPC